MLPKACENFLFFSFMIFPRETFSFYMLSILNLNCRLAFCQIAN